MQTVANQGWDGKLYNTTPLWNDGRLLSGLQCSTLAHMVHLVLSKLSNKVNYGCKCIALEAKEEAAIVP